MPMRLGTPMPELAGATEWLNGEPELANTPVLVHFWSVSCPICHDNMPTVAQWRERYSAQGLQVVAIHMPRMESDTAVAAVQADATAMGMTEPTAIDNRHAIAEAFGNEYVPAYFLFDAEGKLAGRAAGYAGLKMIDGPLQRLMSVPTA